MDHSAPVLTMQEQFPNGITINIHFGQDGTLRMMNANGQPLPPITNEFVESLFSFPSEESIRNDDDDHLTHDDFDDMPPLIDDDGNVVDDDDYDYGARIMPPLVDDDEEDRIWIETQELIDAQEYSQRQHPQFQVFRDIYNMIDQTFDQPQENIPDDFFEPVKVQLSNQEFDALPMERMSKKFIKKYNIKDTTCPICMEEIKPNCHCTRLQCGHIYHKKCAKKWFTKMCEKPTCPMCRHDVRTKLSASV